MKWIAFFLLLSFCAQAQQPIKQLSYLPAHQYKYGEQSVSPDGKKLLISFADGDKNTFELVDLISMKMIATGTLPGRPTSFSWNDESNLVAADFIGKPSQCYEVKNGMKLLFTCREAGATTFSRNTSFGVKQPLVLYLVNEEYVYQYNNSGKVIDSTEQEEFEFFSQAWYNLLTKNICAVNDNNSEVYYFNAKGQKTKTVALDKIILATTSMIDKNGSLYLYGDGKKFNVYDLLKERLALSFPDKEYHAVAFTPDSRSILLKTKNGFEKINLETKQSSVVSYPAYYHTIFPVSFGTELLCLDSKGISVFACKDYLPVQASSPVKDKPLPPVVTTPVTKPNPPVTKTEPTPVPVKWTLPYKLTDFLMPLANDSFHLYTEDRSLRKLVVYGKVQDAILWTNAYRYIDCFGFSKDEKFAQVNTYILDITDSSARMASYSKAGLITKPMMIGGQNFLVKIPGPGKKSVSWTNDLYDEKANWTAVVIDYTYKGLKNKCLVVTRKETTNGQAIDETYYFQKGVGLIKIESAGKIYMQRL